MSVPRKHPLPRLLSRADTTGNEVDKNLVYGKTHEGLSHAQVVKYAIWFDKLTKNSEKTVVLDELAAKFVENRLLRSKTEFFYACSVFLKNDIYMSSDASSQRLTVDEFLHVMSKMKLIDIDKFNGLVDSENRLSEKTLVCHERRKMLLDHVVNKLEERNSDMDHMYSDNNASSNEYKSRLNKHQRNLMRKDHKQQRDDTNRFVGKVEFDVYCTQFGDKLRNKRLPSLSRKKEPSEGHFVLQPLEDIFDEKLVQLAGEANEELSDEFFRDEKICHSAKDSLQVLFLILSFCSINCYISLLIQGNSQGPSSQVPHSSSSLDNLHCKAAPGIPSPKSSSRLVLRQNSYQINSTQSKVGVRPLPSNISATRKLVRRSASHCPSTHCVENINLPNVKKSAQKPSKAKKMDMYRLLPITSL